MWLAWVELLLVDLCCPIVEELVALPEEWGGNRPRG